MSISQLNSHHFELEEYFFPPSGPDLHCVFSFSSSSSSWAAALEFAPTRLSFGGLDPETGNMDDWMDMLVIRVKTSN